MTRSRTLPAPLAATLTLTEVAEELVWKAIEDQRDGTVEISLLGISVSNLVVPQAVQIALPVGPDDPLSLGSLSGPARWAVDRAMDRARERFGNSV